MFTRITLVILSWLLTSAILVAQIPDGYYTSAQGLAGEALQNELHQIIDDHTVLSYSDLWSAYYTTDVRNDGSIWDMYSDIPGSEPPYTYMPGSDQCGTYTAEGSCYNREHSFPKSWFNEEAPMQTDLFHIYPTDGYVNGRRSNYPYGETDNPYWTSENGSKLGDCSYPGYTERVFEPIDAYKGDFARTYFYMVVRYQNQVSNWDSPMLSGNGFSDWALNLLLDWHNADPVSQKEIDRNNAAYDWQNNRNPFIDHPEYVSYIWEGAVPEGLLFLSQPVTRVEADSPYEYAIEVATSENPADISISCTTCPNWLTLTDQGEGLAQLSGAPTENEIGQYAISLQATDGQYTETQDFTLEVAEPDSFVTVVSQDFTSCPPDNWEVISQQNTNQWQCNQGYIEANAYGADTPGDDWLILPVLNLDTLAYETLRFSAYTQYTDNDMPGLSVWYTSYRPTTAIDTAHWHALEASLPPADSQNWLPVEVPVGHIAGDSVFLAIRYQSSGTGASSSSLWQVDDVILKGVPTDATLTNSRAATLTLDGQPLPEFHPDRLFYTISLAFGETTIPQVDATAESAQAQISISQATQLETGNMADRTAKIVITAPDGRTQSVYRLQMNPAGLPPVRTMAEIQETTAENGESSLLGEWVTVKGVVTAVNEATGFYYLQETSDPWQSLAVNDPAHTPISGDSLLVAGQVTETDGLTQVQDVAHYAPTEGPFTWGATAAQPLADFLTEAYESGVLKAAMLNCSEVQPEADYWLGVNVAGTELAVNRSIIDYRVERGGAYQVTGVLTWRDNRWQLLPFAENHVQDVTAITQLAGEVYQVYPNPVSNILTLDGSQEVVSLRLFNQYGRLIDSFAKGTRHISVTHLPNGLYVLQVRTLSGIITKKVQVIH